jgi:acetyl-CoA C-acetyltransferase
MLFLIAEEVAKVFNVSRQEQDKFAFGSQQKYKTAFENNNFENEIVPVKLLIRKEEKLIKTDEYPRPDTTLEGLSKLKPCFQFNNGTVTAGNIILYYLL